MGIVYILGDVKMDALELIEKIDEIDILYEPIFSADQHIIVAYEAIPTISNANNTINIVDVTYDASIPAEFRQEIELAVVRKTIERASTILKDVKIYLPCNPNLLMLDFGESYFELLTTSISEEDLKNIVLVIPEHKFEGDFEQLHHAIRYIQTYDVKIALDQIGSESMLDQILMLEPAVLIINVRQLSYDAWGAQNHVFTTIQSLALKIGAILMFDNIQTDYQLHHAWKNGARYFKGKYLKLPSREFIAVDTLKKRFRDECQQFISTEIKLLEQKYDALKNLKKAITTIVDHAKPQSDDIEKLMVLANKLDQYAFRFYICNDEGFQTSPNIKKENNEWIAENKAIGKNWSWRPYFLQNIVELRHGAKGNFSNVYSDIETGELTRTFSMAINESEYIFIDITYDYLYEHNIVN